MFFTKYLASFALATLLLCGSSSATPQFESEPIRPLDSRDDPNSDKSAILEPVVPPGVDEDDLGTLALGTRVVLAWAGSKVGSSSQRKLKRDGAVFSEASFKFAYPTIPLDYSSYISGISCSGGRLTSTLTPAAYKFAKKNWSGKGKLVFITSVDGCGSDNTNDLFLAKSITFSDSKRTFTAQGSSAGYRDVATNLNLKWGDLGTLNLKRAVDKRDMFEPHGLHNREVSLGISWGLYLNDFLGIDKDSPWDNAALLAKYNKTGGKTDTSYSKGEIASDFGHHKRSNESALEERKVVKTTEKTFGLAAYCVECGFSGTAEIWGDLDVDLIPFKVTKAQVGFRASFKAGLYLGLVAFVKYEKKYTKSFPRKFIPGFEIPLLAGVGPFVELSFEATMTIQATGSLLLGTAIEWNNIDIMIDLLDYSNSHARGFNPIFTKKKEVAGELKITTSLGMPVKLGLGIDLLSGTWKAGASIVETPSIVGEGSFEVSGTVTEDGTAVGDVNGGCYGIMINIHFENTVQGVLEGDYIGQRTWNIFRPLKSEPILETCIGYTKDSTEDDDTPDGTGSGSGASGNGLNSGGTGLSGSSGSKSPKCKQAAILSPTVPSV
ncbi:hypothetical protein G7Z17_g850 [Cylindrodendrum hubeiense]|uniref:DUF7029 domain-containing protein n=1 Tax=Cylindrodendrum hubeiense TaxID=595255 RepID=A0A9P5HH45_9HYPO|nr:hypothetical protein G7Z17_g850 [Cylindrodendrum hubeiense]